MTNSQLIKRCKQHKCTLKNCQANKFSKTSIAIRFNLFLVCPSVPPFFLPELFTPPQHLCFEQLFKCLTQYIVAVSTERILRNLIHSSFLSTAHQVHNFLFSIRGFSCCSSDHSRCLLIRQSLYAPLTSHKVTNFHGEVGVFLFLSNLKTRQMRVPVNV